MVEIENPGTYLVWMLVCFTDDRSDACRLESQKKKWLKDIKKRKKKH